MASQDCTGPSIAVTSTGEKKRKRVKVIPKSTYTVYIDEGLTHLKKMNYRGAKACFEAALEERPNDQMALISQSQCNMHLGLHDEALRDAEKCIGINSHFIPGLLQFGEVLFSLGFFEKALIYYHQGRRLRKNCEAFRRGIAKAEHAISNAIIDRAATQIEDIEDLIPLIEEIENEDSFSRHQCCIRAIGAETLLENRVPLLPSKSKSRERWVTREVLGNLAHHKFFAEKCLERLSDKRRQYGTSTKVQDTIEEIMFFLKHQERLMREMKPMYFRKKGLNFNTSIVVQYEQQEIEHRHSNRTVMKGAAEGAVLKNIAQIEHALSAGRYKDAQLEAARSTRQIHKMTLKQLPRKFEFILDMMHYRGIAFYRQKLYSEAIESFKRQIRLGQKLNNDMVVSRAFDFMARSYALNGTFNEAIDSWEARMDYAKTPLEKAYTNHEIGRCNLELEKRELARYYANESLRFSTMGENYLWGTFARILLGQIELKNSNNQGALEQFVLARRSAARTMYKKTMCSMLREMEHCLKVMIDRDKNAENDNQDDDSEIRPEPPVTVAASDQDFP